MRTPQPLADRRLAVCPGDRDQREAFARLTEHRMCQRSAERAQTLRRQVGNAPFRIPDKIVARFPEHGHCAASDGIGNVAATIGKIARISDEQIARQHLPAVICDAARFDAESIEPMQHLDRCQRGDYDRAAHRLSFAVGAPCATCIDASGEMPSVRKAPPMTVAKIGPATSPP